ncbi:MAG: 16S rRNA (cytosine(1402)-N(4))-methyltransferase RsmH [Pirellula sp.]
MNQPSERPSRRRRYSGRNPKSFQDKYKEHQPEKYPEDIRKIIAAGKTPAGTHRPIMVDEVMRVLALRPGAAAVDCTLGYGGHASALLAAIQPGGRFFGVDADPIEMPKTEARLRAQVASDAFLLLRRMNFAGVSQFLAAEAIEGVDAVLADLGCSSMQYDDPKRGFSFKVDGPLDMRMNPGRGMSVAELLQTMDSDRLTAILMENADEPNADRIAAGILRTQSRNPIVTTFALVEVIHQQLNGLGSDDMDRAIRRVFQSLRIAVNDELRSLEIFLGQIPYSLKQGGRIAVITFHSGEDRRVKASFKRGLESGLFSSISKEVIRPSYGEQQSNQRSKSAKLRFAIRSSNPGSI